MINWARTHPVWATLIGLVLLFVIWMLFFRSSGGSQNAGAVGVVQQDPALVQAGMQLQALQAQGQFAVQQAQIAAGVESERTAAQLAIAELQALFSMQQTELQAEIASQQIAASKETMMFQSTLQAQTEASRIQAEMQAATLHATTAVQLQQSQNELMAAIQESNADVQKQLIASNASVQTASIKAQPKQSLLSRLCLLTTAYVELQGKPDDCAELQLARMWRDTWLAKQHMGCELIALYYEAAPRFLELIKERPDRDDLIRAIGHAFIDPFTAEVEQGAYRNALLIFTNMLEHIGRTYDERTMGAVDAWHTRRSRVLMVAA